MMSAWPAPNVSVDFTVGTARRLGFDRTELEAEGWRTTLDYRENHVEGATAG